MADWDLVNPLNLPVTGVRGIEALHPPTDEQLLANLIADMNARGWVGPPIIADGELADIGQDRAYTGSHRLAAWAQSQHSDDPVPCVWIEDLAEAAGLDWGEIFNDVGRDGYDAAAELSVRIPGDIRSAYGLDTGGHA